jgi:UDP-4-amino-4,6-dideoxy-N-acetyl-beta-L-altrosamine transaminase
MKKSTHDPETSNSSPASFLPYGRQAVDEEDIATVLETLRGDWLTQGPEVDAFESALADVVGADHIVSCSSGTAALHLAIMAAGIGPNMQVVVPANTFLATANMARIAGAEIVFADVDPETGLMTAEYAMAAIEGAANNGISAILPVHIAGQCEAPGVLQELADAHNLTVIEDACHALGTTYDTKDEMHRVGSCAHSAMATFSFHPVKTIAMGEGGAVATNDDELAQRMRDARNHGMIRDAERFVDAALGKDENGSPRRWYYEMHEPGFNYRASSLHCALGRSQLAKLNRFVARRRELAEIYDRLLAPLGPAVQPPVRAAGCEPAWHLYIARFDFDALGTTRNELMNALFEAGIGTQVHYIPVPWQPYYRARYGMASLPGAAAYYESSLSLPLYPTMHDADVERVVATIASLAGLARI